MVGADWPAPSDAPSRHVPYKSHPPQVYPLPPTLPPTSTTFAVPSQDAPKLSPKVPNVQEASRPDPCSPLQLFWRPSHHLSPLKRLSSFSLPVNCHIPVARSLTLERLFISVPPTSFSPYITSSSSYPMARSRLTPSSQRHKKKKSPTKRVMFEKRVSFASTPSVYIIPARQSTPRVMFVPDPPAWTPPSSSRRQTPSPLDQCRDQTQFPPTTTPEHPYISASIGRTLPSLAYLSPPPEVRYDYLPSPPSTPVISRLPTPDFDSPIKDARFCGCCPPAKKCAVAMSKMELQRECSSDPLSRSPCIYRGGMFHIPI
ncbi:hypothetical protein B0T17DRAFT_545325 [Bombardia bombarda]|uniref:Uncharacterized protein n=1 Tax=Bombardia bombarda TaxID=252184 RepID=A0AA39U1X2_9PEZI|nr:hypothetical protein B0T17DRAFT_545325 [Bombardia bombarda]